MSACATDTVVVQVETKSIIASTTTRAFLDGQRCGSALQGPKLLRLSPGDTQCTEISILTCRHAQNVALAGDSEGQIGNGAITIITCHAALYGPDTWSFTLCSTVTLLRPIYKRYLYILIFEHPRSQRKEIKTIKEKEKLK